MYNKVLSFDAQFHPIIQVFTDTYLEGLDGFYYSISKLFWNQTILALEQKKLLLFQLAPHPISNFMN